MDRPMATGAHGVQDVAVCECQCHMAHQMHCHDNCHRHYVCVEQELQEEQRRQQCACGRLRRHHYHHCAGTGGHSSLACCLSMHDRAAHTVY